MSLLVRLLFATQYENNENNMKKEALFLVKSVKSVHFMAGGALRGEVAMPCAAAADFVDAEADAVRLSDEEMSMVRPDTSLPGRGSAARSTSASSRSAARLVPGPGEFSHKELIVARTPTRLDDRQGCEFSRVLGVRGQRVPASRHVLTRSWR